MDHILPINPSWPRTKVKNSGLIQEIAYYPEKKTLYVHFKTNDTVYAYAPLERKDYDKLADSPSVGGYFSNHIKNKKNLKCNKV